MKVPYLVGGRFRERLNRFSCMVEVDAEVTPCFLPNPGRLKELLTPGRRLLLAPQNKTHRKTSFDLFAVRHPNGWVVVDSRIPNLLVYEALTHGDIPELRGYSEVKKEPSYRSSRFDFLLEGGNIPCLLEVKSCTLVEDGIAMFPDAPTSRGRRHMEELLHAKENGLRACVLFLIQREDARIFRPNDATDDKFGVALRRAAAGGVEVLAYSSTFDGREVRLNGRVPIKL